MVPGSLSVRRRRYGYLVAVGGTAALTAVLVPLRGHLDLTSDALLFLLLVVSAAILGGLGPALVAGALGALLLNFFFTSPFHTLRIQRTGEIVAVLVFAAVALMVSWVVDLAERRASAAREAAELEAGNRLRTALLAAVGHDLRTPARRRQGGGVRAPERGRHAHRRGPSRAAGDGGRGPRPARRTGRQPARHEPAAGRSDARAPAPYRVDEVVARALDDLGAAAGRCVRRRARGPAADVRADPGLLERVLANVVERPALLPPDGRRC